MSVLLAPETSRGRGSAHLRRAVALLEALPGSRMLVEAQAQAGRLGSLLAGVDPSRIVAEAQGPYDLIVVDRFHASPDAILGFLARGCTIGVDLGGAGRPYCDYVIDTLPRLDESAANEADVRLLDLPEAEGEETRRPGTILVSFGGEDPARLTEPVAALLAQAGLGDRVRIVAPSMRSLGPLPAGLEVLGPQPTLEPLLRRAERVITSFGMTAYEAQAVGAKVVTIAPTRYHDRLARKAGFARAGVGSPVRRRLLTELRRTGEAAPPAAGLRGDGGVGGKARREMARLIGDLPLPARRGCPAHPGSFGAAVWRAPEKSYFRCPRCGLVYLERFAPDEEHYGASYFMEEYRAQYGRTYLEDFDHIAAMGERRLSRARSVAKRRLDTVLDVGCAYGPFLATARMHGLTPYGVDVADEAIAHVRRLGIEAVCGSILDTDPASVFDREAFDLVSLWYVVEHFDRLDELLCRLADLVAPGGVLAMSTPHARGVSARRSRDRFYSASPRDHFTIWDRSSARRVLLEYGFRVRAFVATGHHPERYPAVQSAAGRIVGCPAHALAALHSRLFGWGDTFELYAVREER